MDQDSKPPAKTMRSCGIRALVGIGILGALSSALWSAVESARDAPRRNSCIGQNKIFGLMMLDYYDKERHFPPAYIADAKGRPQHSWRILLPPYERLLEEYRFNEAWDSPHNRSLAVELPIGMSFVYPMYHCINDVKSDKFDTSYVVVVGKETFSPGSRGRTEEEITDGTSNTIVTVEMSESGIPWMEPRDLNFDAMSFKINDPVGPGIRSKHPGTVVVQYGDAHVEVVDENIDPEVLKNLLRVSDGKQTTIDP